MVWLNIFLLLVGAALTVFILIQSRSAGMSGAFGGGAEGFHVRRGSEKIIFRITIALAVIFLLTAVAHIFIQ